MQTVSAEVRQLLDSYARVNLYVYVDGEKLSAGVGSGTYTGSCAGEDEFSFGNACAANVNVTIAAARPELKDRRAQVNWAVDATEYPLITGKIASAKVSAGKTELEIWDDIYFAGSRPMSMQDAVLVDCTAATAFSSVGASMGIGVDPAALELLDGIPLSGGLSKLDSDISNSSVAGHLAGLVGGNALISREGLLTIRQYATIEWQTEPYSGGAEAENEDLTFAGITLQRQITSAGQNEDGTTAEVTETEEFSAGDGSLMISNPLACQTAADCAFGSLSNVVVRPGSFSFPGGLLLEPGDVFSLHSMDGTYSVAVGSISMTLDGGVRSTVSCGSSVVADRDDSGAHGQINQALSAIIRDFARFKKIEADNAKFLRAEIAELFVRALYADTIMLKPESEFYSFTSIDELNEFVESVADHMELHTMRSFGAQVEFDDLNGYGVITVFVGIDGDAFKYATALLMCNKDLLVRNAYSEGSGDTAGEHQLEWGNAWTSIRNGIRSLTQRNNTVPFMDELNGQLSDMISSIQDYEVITIHYYGELHDGPWLIGTLERISADVFRFRAIKLENGRFDHFVEYYADGAWGPVEWDNPQLMDDVEYMTQHRYHGEPVTQKLDSATGQLLWKTSGDWQTYAALTGAFPKFNRVLTGDDDVDLLYDDGIYVYPTQAVTDGLKNAPFDNAAVVMVFGANSTSTQKVQLGFRYGMGGQGKFRSLYNGSWHTWAEFAGYIEDAAYPGCYYRYTNGVQEWVNPPMAPGVEYRTTERHNGQPVYVVALHYDALPNNDVAYKNLPYKTPKIISVSGAMTNGTLTNPFPYFGFSDGAIYAILQVRAVYSVGIKTYVDMSAYSADVTVKYTKEE